MNRLEDSLLSAVALLSAVWEHLWFIAAPKQCDAEAVAYRLAHHIASAHRRVLGLPRPDWPPGHWSQEQWLFLGEVPPPHRWPSARCN